MEFKDLKELINTKLDKLTWIDYDDSSIISEEGFSVTIDYYKNIGEEFDAVCLLQTTSPFRTVEFLDQALEKFITSNTDSLVSVKEVPHEFNPHWTFKLNEQGNLKIATGENEIITRRQDLPKAYHRDGSIYITKTSVLVTQKSLYGNSIAYIENSNNEHVNIDTIDDKLSELKKKSNVTV